MPASAAAVARAAAILNQDLEPDFVELELIVNCVQEIERLAKAHLRTAQLDPGILPNQLRMRLR